MANEKFIRLNGKLLNKARLNDTEDGSISKLPVRINKIYAINDGVPVTNDSIIPYVIEEAHNVTYSRGTNVDTISGPNTVNESTMQFHVTGTWTKDTQNHLDGIACSITNGFCQGGEDSDTTFSIYCYTDKSGPIAVEAHAYWKCLFHGTKVLMADYTTKNIEDITYDDLVLTYNPYLQKFIGAYPNIITIDPKTCVEHVRHLKFSSGRELCICGGEKGGHYLLMKEGTQYIFKYISAVFPEDNIIGKTAVATDGVSFIEDTIIGYEDEFFNSGGRAYNVFVPMQGCIITEGIITGGNLLMDDHIAGLANIKNYNNQLCDYVTSKITNSSIIEAQQKLSEKIEFEAPINIVATTYLQFIFDNPEIAGEAVFDGIKESLWAFSSGYMPFNQLCKVKIGDEIYDVPFGWQFTFPATYNDYFDTSNYKHYKPGDKKIVYNSTVVIGS